MGNGHVAGVIGIVLRLVASCDMLRCQRSTNSTAASRVMRRVMVPVVRLSLGAFESSRQSWLFKDVLCGMAVTPWLVQQSFLFVQSS